MHIVYSSAATVYIILSGPSSLTDDALDFMAGPGIIQTVISNKNFVPLLNQTFSGCIEIRQNNFWTRAWILQEVGLALNAIVLCRSRSVDFVKFRDCMRFLSTFKSPGILAYPGASLFPRCVADLSTFFAARSHSGLFEVWFCITGVEAPIS